MKSLDKIQKIILSERQNKLLFDFHLDYLKQDILHDIEILKRQGQTEFAIHYSSSLNLIMARRQISDFLRIELLQNLSAKVEHAVNSFIIEDFNKWKSQ